jgi:hypothetical protein
VVVHIENFPLQFLQFFPALDEVVHLKRTFALLGTDFPDIPKQPVLGYFVALDCGLEGGYFGGELAALLVPFSESFALQIG